MCDVFVCMCILWLPFLLHRNAQNAELYVKNRKPSTLLLGLLIENLEMILSQFTWYSSCYLFTIFSSNMMWQELVSHLPLGLYFRCIQQFAKVVQEEISSHLFGFFLLHFFFLFCESHRNVTIADYVETHDKLSWWLFSKPQRVFSCRRRIN